MKLLSVSLLVLALTTSVSLHAGLGSECVPLQPALGADFIYNFATIKVKPSAVTRRTVECPIGVLSRPSTNRTFYVDIFQPGTATLDFTCAARYRSPTSNSVLDSASAKSNGPGVQRLALINLRSDIVGSRLHVVCRIPPGGMIYQLQ